MRDVLSSGGLAMMVARKCVAVIRGGVNMAAAHRSSQKSIPGKGGLPLWRS